MDYPILTVESSFLSYNAKFCKRCENMYIYIRHSHLKYSHYEFESDKIWFYIVDYPILGVENSFLSQNTKSCKRCENMYIYIHMSFTPKIFILWIRKCQNRILHRWLPYINCWYFNYILKHRLLVKGVKICIYTCQNRKWWNFAKIISGAHLHYKWILHTKFGSNQTVRFRRVERTDVRTYGRTDGRRTPSMP